MTNIGHIGIILSMTLFLLPTLVLAQSPFSYIPLVTKVDPTASAAVDIVVEANTYTPSFYLGRAEPISGSQIKLVAIPHIEILARAASYRWQVAGKNLDNEPKAEFQSVTIAVPVGSSLNVKVEVFDKSGKVIATKTDLITISDMNLAFYENNPLRGLNKVAIDQDLIMVGDEISVTAIPYFSNSSDINTNLKTYWTVDNKEYAPENLWKITIERNQLNRDSLINFVMQNHRTLESAEKNFTLKL